MNLDLYDKVFQKFLQSKVTFKCNNKSLKTGVIKLFNIKQYFIKFYIETEKKETKILELPYPFLVDYDSEICCLNYKLSSLCNNHEATMKLLTGTKFKNTHKIYDNIVEIITLK